MIFSVLLKNLREANIVFDRNKAFKKIMLKPLSFYDFTKFSNSLNATVYDKDVKF